MNNLVKGIAIASAVSLMAVGSAGAVNAQSKDDNGRIQVETKQGQSKWKFNSKRHERRRDRADRFRFHFGGFWYPQPYWLGYGLPVNLRISCGEGRAIVDARGYNRVRTIECRGGTYAYLGRRHGDSFKVLVNARTGRIVDVDRIS
jgi:hypothetical protein